MKLTAVFRKVDEGYIGSWRSCPEQTLRPVRWIKPGRISGKLSS